MIYTGFGSRFKGRSLEEKMYSLGHCPNYPSSHFEQLVPLFSDVENYVFAGITGPSNDDYDNDGSDNCDHNFGTFDDFGVKNDQKVSNNMILMSKYKGKHGGKKGQQIRAMPERKRFFSIHVFPKLAKLQQSLASGPC